MQNTTQKNLLIFGNQQANRIVFIFTTDEKWKKKTNKHWQTIEVSLFSENSHTSKRTQGPAHREHTCVYVCVCASPQYIYRLHLFCLISINVRTQENEKNTIQKLRSPILMIHSVKPGRRKKTEFNTKKIFSFLLFCFTIFIAQLYFFRLKN